MSGLQDLAKLGGRLTSLGDVGALISKVEELRQQFKAIQAESIAIGRLINNPEQLISLIFASPPDPVFEAIFQKAPFAGIINTLRDARAKLASNTELSKLMMPLSALNETREGDARIDIWSYGSNFGRITLPLFEVGGQAGSAGGDYHLEAHANAGLECEAGTLWPDPEGKVTERLVRLGAHLDAGAGGKAAVPLLGGHIGIGGAASLECWVQYFFRPDDANGFFAAEAARAVTRLCNPFDFDDVWTAMASTHLYGLTVKCDGQASVGVQISIAPDLVSSPLISANLGLTFDASIRRRGKYQLALQSGAFDGDHSSRIRVALQRSDSAESRLALGVGLDVDLTGLGARVHQVLEQALTQWDSLLARIKPFLSPGTYLRNNAQHLLIDAVNTLAVNPAVKQALAGDLELALGLRADNTSAVAEFLLGHVHEAVDHATGLLDKENNHAQGIIDQLSQPLKLFAGVTEPVKQIAKKELNKLVASLDSLLRDEVAALVGSAPANLGALFGKIGAKVAGDVSKLDNALASVRDLISKYDALFRKIVDASADQARQKIALRVNWEREAASADETEVTGIFTDQQAAAHLYHDLIRGDLNAFRDMMEKGITTIPGFELVPEHSSIGRFARLKKDFKYDVVVFGFGGSGEKLKLGEADVQVLADGTVRVEAQGTGSVEAKSHSEARTLSLVSAWSLVQARRESGAPPETRQSMRASFRMIHDDKKLERDECDGFLTDLKAKSLISQGQLDHGRSNYDDWVKASGDKKIAASMSLEFKLPGTGIDRLICKELQGNEMHLSLPNAVMTGRYAIESLLHAGQWRDDDRGAAMESLRKKEVRFAGFTDEQILLALIADVLASPNGEIDLHCKKDGEAQDALKRAASFVRFVDTMRSIYFAEPVGSNESVSETRWSAKEYRDAELLMMDATRIWMKLNKKFLGSFRAELSPVTSAFILTLLAAANRMPGLAANTFLLKDVPANALAITMARKDATGTWLPADTF